MRLKGGRFVLDAASAATVRRVYRMAAEGHGIGAIAKRLNSEDVPPSAAPPTGCAATSPSCSSAGPRWGSISRTRGGTGTIIENPTARRSPATSPRWSLRINGTRPRRHALPASERRPPVEARELVREPSRDARDGGTLHQVNKGKKSSGPSLVNYKAALGVKGARYVGFPLDVLERAVLSVCAKSTRGLLPEGDDAADRVLILTGKRADAEGRMEKIKAQLVEGGELAPLVDVLRTLDAKLMAINDELAAAKREAASPLSGAWGECRTLLDAVESDPDPEDGAGALAVGPSPGGRFRLVSVRRPGSSPARRRAGAVHRRRASGLPHPSPAGAGERGVSAGVANAGAVVEDAGAQGRIRLAPSEGCRGPGGVPEISRSIPSRIPALNRSN